MPEVRIVQAEFEKSAAAVTDYPPADLPEVAFCGRSNVGKSTLINGLVARRTLVRASRTPGRTRLVNFFVVEVLDREGHRRKLRMVDLPGYGYAKVSKEERAGWRPAIQRYLGDREALVAVALLVDARRGAEEEECALAPWIAARGVKVIPVVTKADQVAKHERKLAAERAQRVLGAVPVLFSALSGEGVGELWSRLLTALPPEPISSEE